MTACLIPPSLSPSEDHKNVVTVTLRIHFKIIIVNSFLAFNSYALLNRLWHAQFKLQILNLLEWHFFLRLFCVKCSRVSVAILRRWLKVVIVKWQIVIEKKVLERLALRRHGRDMLTKDLDDRSEKINLLMLLLTALLRSLPICLFKWQFTKKSRNCLCFQLWRVPENLWASRMPYIRKRWWNKFSRFTRKIFTRDDWKERWRSFR